MPGAPLSSAAPYPESYPESSADAGSDAGRTGAVTGTRAVWTGRVRRLFGPLTRPVTYTRWLHMWVSVVAFALWMFIDSSRQWVPALLLGLAGLVPAMRTGEGLQARYLLFAAGDPERERSVTTTPAITWADRGRTVLWLEARFALGILVVLASVQLPLLSEELIRSVLTGSAVGSGVAVPVAGHHWWFLLLAPLPLFVLYGLVVGSGALLAELARRLLGPSAAQRLVALEERTELLLERNRMARELHDSIGHALTVAVLQAGAARTANRPEFTERALTAIEETGRAALEDLERVLLVLREQNRPVGPRPTLADADRLLESARLSGAEVSAEVSGPLDRVPGAVSREGYRMVQEALTNVLRHAGPGPVRVRVAIRIAVGGESLSLEVRNPVAGAVGSGAGSGLRGIRERAALLGGRASVGMEGGEWVVRVSLPVGA